MDALELRNKWIESIANVDDRFLRMVDALYESYKEEDCDPYDALPEEAKQLIELGLKDAEEGRLTPHEEVMAKFREKYNIASA